MIPSKLKKGDGVRVITPSRSLKLPWINEELKQIAIQRFKELGLNLSFGKHVNEFDDFCSSSIKSRVEDLHDAFMDDSIKLIITAIGGFNSNQLLDYIDYDLIKKHPKIFVGYSDITALLNSIYAKTDLVTYSGPQFFTFGDKKGFNYTLEYFKKCLMSEESFLLKPPKKWSDDRWANEQENRKFFDNDGYWVLNQGEAQGKIIGANMCTIVLLEGTIYWPSLKDSILFLEEDDWKGEETILDFDRNLQSLIHQKDFLGVKGIVIGRFQTKSKVTKEILTKAIKSKKELENIPIIANVDISHTTPHITFPIGGTAKISARKNNCKIDILKH